MVVHHYKLILNKIILYIITLNNMNYKILSALMHCVIRDVHCFRNIFSYIFNSLIKKQPLKELERTDYYNFIYKFVHFIHFHIIIFL